MFASENHECGIDTREPRRRHTRWASDEQVVLYIEGTVARGWLLNFSQSGCRVLVDLDCLASIPLLDLVGFAVIVRLGKRESKAAKAARVVWSRPGNGGAVMGLAFCTRRAGAKVR
jgi:hypothetical protein